MPSVRAGKLRLANWLNCSAFAKGQPIRRAGLPEDIANAALWLASDESSFVTGHALVVDGGVSAGQMWTQQMRWIDMIESALGFDLPG